MSPSPASPSSTDAAPGPASEPAGAAAALDAFLRAESTGHADVAWTLLDGAGRTEAKALERSVSLTYATESMRLTTRLMQLASWLLLHRAVKEGEMSLAQASKEKNKVKIAPTDTHDQTNVELLPIALQDLIARSLKLQGLVRRLDTTIHNRVAIEQPLPVNPVERQMGLLKAAFGAESA